MSKPVIIIIVVVVAILGLGGVYLATRKDEPAQTASSSTATAPEDHSAHETAPATSNDSTSSNSVTISGFAFSPTKLTVKKGATVTWTNKDSTAHTVTSDGGGMLDSGTLDQGEMYTMTFDAAGTFAYHCELHPNMKATIVVTE